MRESFHGYYRLSQKEESKLWDTGLIVLDANVLLNVYRYSEPTRDALLSVLSRLSDRLWLPHQFASEFHQRRLDVIVDQADACRENHQRVRTVLELLQSRRSPMLLSKSQVGMLEEIRDALLERETAFEQLLSEDQYLTTIAGLFEGRVGKEPTPSELSALQKEGEQRFANNTPPGFKDAQSKSGARVFGDFIGWRQILNHSKTKGIDILFVTDDRKSDWWSEPKRGRATGPRPELLKEFRDATGRLFYMYPPDRFIETAGSRLKLGLGREVVEEAREKSISSHQQKASESDDQLDSPKAESPRHNDDYSSLKHSDAADVDDVREA